MRFIITLLIGALAAIPVFPAQAQNMAAPAARAQSTAPSESIAAVVNSSAITASDVAERRRLIMVSSGMPDTDDMRARVTPQIVNMLIDEALMLQEAKRLGIEIEDKDIRDGFAALAAQNKFTPEQFAQILSRSGLTPAALNSQIRAQLAWSKVVARKVRPQIEITENQIDAAIDRLKRDEGKEEYLVAEIYLPVENPDQERDVKQLADRLTTEMKAGKAPFSAVAAQFSQAASASKGGDKGWVQKGQLPEAVDEALGAMKPGELSLPIRSLTGYHILLLRKKREITAETMPTRDEMLNRIGNEQLDRMQRRYLLDLKSAAFIERRA